MRFAVVSDIHAEQHYDWSTLVFQRMGARTDLDFIATLGDWTTHPDRDGYRWEKYLPGLLSHIKVPILGCRGNHDYVPGQWRKQFGLENDYVREIDGIRLLFMHNTDWNEDRYRWLEREAAVPARMKMFFAHQHPRLNDWKHNSFGDSARLCATLSHRGFAASFHGHIHAYAEQTVGGVRYFITGGGGGERYNVQFPVRMVCNHYLLVETDGVSLDVKLCQQHRDREEVHQL